MSLLVLGARSTEPEGVVERKGDLSSNSSMRRTGTEEQPSVTLFEIDPLTDPRWQEFVDHHPQGSVFMGSKWMRALAMTYDYRPVAITTSAPGEPLANGIALCEVRSWITGLRFVSLPFTDYCLPLVSDGDELRRLLWAFRVHPAFVRARYAEFRGGSAFANASSDLCAVSARYVQHALSLEPSLQQIYNGFHTSCIQRAIRRADREGLRIECGRSDSLIRSFYRLMVQTRRRHGLPPPPMQWFKNLASVMGEQLQIRIAFRGEQALAGIVTLTHGHTMTYKYGASDARWHKLGAVPQLMWSAIQDAKAANLSIFHFGRTDLQDRGLVQFKERFGAVPEELVYYRMSNQETSKWLTGADSGHVARKLFRKLPGTVLEVFGRLLYRHVG